MYSESEEMTAHLDELYSELESLDMPLTVVFLKDGFGAHMDGAVKVHTTLKEHWHQHLSPRGRERTWNSAVLQSVETAQSLPHHARRSSLLELVSTLARRRLPLPSLCQGEREIGFFCGLLVLG